MKCLVLAILSCTLAIQGKPYGYGPAPIGMGGMSQMGGYQGGGGIYGSNYDEGGQGGYQAGGFNAHGAQGGHDSSHHSSSFTSYVNAEQSGGHDSSGGSSFDIGGGGEEGYGSYGAGGSNYGEHNYGGGFNSMAGGMGMGPMEK